MGYDYYKFNLGQFSFDRYFTFASHNENYKLKKLLAKLEKLLTFLPFAFVNLV